MLVLYHRDLDGICSAAIVDRFDKSEVKIFYSINYNEEIPFDLVNKKGKVYIVDFSLKKHEWEILFSLTKNIVWIDHHKSIFESYCPSDLDGTRISGKASSQLTWEYFSKESSPVAVKLIADYDIWTFNYKEKTMAFHYGVQSEINYTNPESTFWKHLLNKDTITTSMINKITKNGVPINQYEINKNKQFVTNNKKYITFKGVRCITANIRSDSTIFDSIDPTTFDMILLFSFNGDTWNVSLYSKKIDVSVIARNFGGGGHTGAAGFEADFQLIQRILNNEIYY